MTKNRSGTPKRWWPTSKMTAVGIVWGLVTYGAYAFTAWYGLKMDLVSGIAISGGLMFIVGYAVTEYRCNCPRDH